MHLDVAPSRGRSASSAIATSCESSFVTGASFATLVSTTS
jgi:hypothetical protein